MTKRTLEEIDKDLKETSAKYGQVLARYGDCLYRAQMLTEESIQFKDQAKELNLQASKLLEEKKLVTAEQSPESAATTTPTEALEPEIVG